MQKKCNGLRCPMKAASMSNEGGFVFRYILMDEKG